ncbi:MAG: toll/interleukin-1 receptor domain-containing protein, partial [Deltaproteobacteria bacterium]|nr:toll/interleukin-1 receptor domain-containing protein [Deltaproteobacteria bacterium]
RNVVAAAGIDVTQLPVGDDARRRATVMPRIDEAFGRLDPSRKLTALGIITEQLLAQNRTGHAELHALLGKHGFQYVDGSIVPIGLRDAREEKGTVPDHPYPLSASEVLATLAEILRAQGEGDAVELLETANAMLGEPKYDNWDGGTYYYTLRLEIPSSHYGRLRNIERLEEHLTQAARAAFQHYGDPTNQHLSQVVISPRVEQAAGPRGGTAAEAAVAHLWRPGRLRLFLGHLAEYKREVGALRDALTIYGVSAFVAHVDIEPTLEWQDQIELALRSMHAFAPLLTPRFETSKWTGQEIGFAVARGVPIIAVRLGVDPYGFIAKQQALSGNLSEPEGLASGVVDALIHHRFTRVAMREALVAALGVAPTARAAEAVTAKLGRFTDFTSDQLTRLGGAVDDNVHVSETSEIRERVERIARRVPPAATQGDADDIPF